MNYRGLVVTGADTGAGKTAVACGLARLFRERGRRVGVLKPVETGCAGDGLAPADGLALAAAAGIEFGSGISVDDVVPWRFRAPLAPMEAARMEGVEIGVDRIYQAMDRWMDRAELVIVETAGGLLAPINPRFTMADLLLGFSLPVVVAAANRLGVINHVLLTLEALERRGMSCAGVVLVQVAEELDLSADSNARLVREFGGVAVYEAAHDPDDPARAAAEALRPYWDEIMDTLSKYPPESSVIDKPK